MRGRQVIDRWQGIGLHVGFATQPTYRRTAGDEMLKQYCVHFPRAYDKF
ncbi:MAG: hypothetical protein CM15mP83_0850 [Flavobacteriaceae bacterium]|nr:MAG: hypothetical protein CM15mP83_0850 [Flavobacteriaceae bacterium]